MFRITIKYFETLLSLILLISYNSTSPIKSYVVTYLFFRLIHFSLHFLRLNNFGLRKISIISFSKWLENCSKKKNIQKGKKISNNFERKFVDIFSSNFSAGSIFCFGSELASFALGFLSQDLVGLVRYWLAFLDQVFTGK